MNLFILNLLLAIGFTAVTAQFSLTGIVLGFAIGYAALWITQPLYEQPEYFHRVSKAIQLVCYFLFNLFASNLRVFWDVVTPLTGSNPGIIAIPLSAKTDIEIMLVANLISLTPGTLSLEVSDDRRFLFVHFMFLESKEAAIREIKEGIERRVLEAIR